MRKWVLAFGLALVAAAVSLPGALGGQQAVPGVTARAIVVGGTFPLSGSASSYAPIPRGMAAYFSYINARKGTDGKRGVAGRQVVFKFYDDAFNPVQTIQRTRQLVEEDRVFALVGGLGTEPQLAVREYLNERKVPQLYVSSGATTWGVDQRRFPWTIGWQPDYQAEAALYGRYITQNLPDAKIAIIFQNDDYGKDYIAGLEAGLGAKKNQIVATRGFQITDPSVVSQVVDLRRSGADTLMIFATPAKTIQTYATIARVGWKPANVFLNSVSATDAFMTTAVNLAGAATVNGSISTYYLKDPANPSWNNDAGMKLYLQIMERYLPEANVKDGLYLYGMAKAHTFVQALYKAGANPTRDSLMKAVLNLTDRTNPFSLPGAITQTRPGDAFPISHQRLQRFNNGTWQPIGPLVNTRGK
jgi:ABC-type branched-subunit amino acid transport system substrate-binding protein